MQRSGQHLTARRHLGVTQHPRCFPAGGDLPLEAELSHHGEHRSRQNGAPLPHRRRGVHRPGHPLGRLRHPVAPRPQRYRKVPGYGLAVNYILDWLGRTLDQIGGIFGRGWEERAYQANLVIAAFFGGIGLLSWLGSRIHKLFSFLRVLPQLGSRIVYVAGMFLYLLDTLLAVGLEIGVRRIYHVDWFALHCLVLHALVLLVLAYGFSTGLWGLFLGFRDLFSFLRHPRATLRKAREEAQDSTD
ncbi:MAG: hypothetical protein AB1758_36915 [Candidatus Eremiobacterota bacterium]